MELYYKEYGEGFPLLILHGLLGSSGNWHTLSRNVFSKEYRVLTVDLRNHGQSPHSEEMSYALMAEDVSRLAARLELDRVHVLGHSMGGKVAMELAVRYPDLVDKLIVVDIAPKTYPDHHSYILDALEAVDIDKIESRQEVDKELSRAIEFDPVRQFLLKNLGYDSTAGYSWKPNLHSIRETYSHIAGAPMTGQFSGSVLFIRGGKSDYISDTDFEQIRDNFPYAALVTIANAGHWVHAEAPSEFAERVMEFLDDDD